MHRVRTWSMSTPTLRGHNRTSYDESVDGRSFDWNFKSGALPPHTYFSRASTATYIGSDGLVKTAQIDEPRFEYTSSGSPRGLLIEPNGTNVINWSESFATSGGVTHNWADLNITRNSTTATSPAGTATALEIQSTAANGSVIMTAGLSTVSRMVSIWIKRISGTGSVQYTLNGGSTWSTISSTFSNSTSWIRWNLGLLASMSRFGIRLVTSGDVIQIWGAQAEVARISSYIPTGSSSATRSADFVSIDYSNAPWFNSNEGTFCVSADRNSSEAATVYGLEGDGSVYCYLITQLNSTQFRTRWELPDSTTGSEIYGLTATSSNQAVYQFSQAFTYRREPSDGRRDFYSGTDGISGSPTTSQVVGFRPDDAEFASLIFWYLGRSDIFLNLLNGHIRRIAYWPTAFTNGIGTANAVLFVPIRSLLYES